MKKLLSVLLALGMLLAFAACEKIEPETGEGTEDELMARIAALEDELAELTGGAVVPEPIEPVDESAAVSVEPSGEITVDPFTVPDFAIPDDFGVTEEKVTPGDYADIVRQVLAVIESNGGTWAQPMNSGCLADFDGDGVNEMALLYSPDGVSVHALFARQTADGKTRCLDQYVCDLAGAAAAEIWMGELAAGAGLDATPLVHIFYTNSDGDEQFGRDSIVSLADRDIRLIHTLTWDGNDFANAHVHSGDLGETDDRDTFLELYISRTEKTITFPAGEIGVPLEALLDQ